MLGLWKKPGLTVEQMVTRVDKLQSEIAVLQEWVVAQKDWIDNKNAYLSAKYASVDAFRRSPAELLISDYSPLVEQQLREWMEIQELIEMTLRSGNDAALDYIPLCVTYQNITPRELRSYHLRYLDQLIKDFQRDRDAETVRVLAIVRSKLKACL